MRRRRKEAAAYIREKHKIPCSPAYLAKLAVQGGGPRYRKSGRYPLYDDPDLDEWAEARLSPVYSSTSEYVDRSKKGHSPQSAETAHHS